MNCEKCGTEHEGPECLLTRELMDYLVQRTLDAKRHWVSACMLLARLCPDVSRQDRCYIDACLDELETSDPNIEIEKIGQVRQIKVRSKFHG